MRSVDTRSAPCIPGDHAGTCCLAGLLLGVACCRRGDCAMCARDRARMLRIGFSEKEVARRFARRRRRLLSNCPACGFPPPPPLQELPPLPRLDRTGRSTAPTWTCRACGRSLPPRRRVYCSYECWREHVRRTEMAGEEVVSPVPPRVYRMAPLRQT